MRKLYEIEQDIANLIEIDADRFVDGETGEIISKEDFDALQMEWSAKVEGIALGYKNEDAEAKAIKEEIDKLTERMNRHKKKAEGYKNFLAMVLDGKKFETAKALIKPTKSKVCEWDGNIEGMEKYLVPQEPKFDKAQARKDMLAGVEVPHCTFCIIKLTNCVIYSIILARDLATSLRVRRGALLLCGEARPFFYMKRGK